MTKRFLMLLLTMTFLLLGSGPMMAQTASEPVSFEGVTPYIIPGANNGGNRTCVDVGVAIWNNATYYQCWSAGINAGDWPVNTDLIFPNISSNELCNRNVITASHDGTFVKFTAGPDGVGAAIIKGGNDSNIYVYEPQALSDSRLASPENDGGNQAALSNTGGFCWNPVGPDEVLPECYADETAWANGSRYTRRGNWATYTTYASGREVVLWAGQTLDAGYVTFSAPSDGFVTITIELNHGWRFALNPVGDGFEDNVKVQDYASPPSGNPAPGLFAHKKFADGLQTTTIVVPVNNFCGVHVDVEQLVDCPDLP